HTRPSRLSHPLSFALVLPHRALRLFPTRRSSDLAAGRFVRDHESRCPLVSLASVGCAHGPCRLRHRARHALLARLWPASGPGGRSEEHTSELQSREKLVCRLLLEKKKKIRVDSTT